MKETRFKQTEIGLVPEDWEVVRLGDVSNIYRGGSPRPIEAYLTPLTTGINWIKIGDVAQGAKYINHTEERIKESGISSSRRVYKGDFLLSNSMSFGRPYILNVNGCIHDGWLVIQNYDNSFIRDFLYYSLSSEGTLSQYRKMAAGSSVQNLNKDKVAEVKLILPPLPEQRKIAEALGDLDTLIAELEKLIAKKRLIKQGAMQQLLTGRTRLKGFNESWKTLKLSDCLTIGNGRDYSHLSFGSVPVFGTGGIMCYVNESLYNGETVCIGRKGTIDHPLYHKGKIWTVDTLFYTHSFINCQPKYIYYLFLTIDWYALNEATGVPSLQKTNIYNLEVSIPSLQEQHAIASILTDMDNEITELEKKKSKYEKLKQGMMQQLLTGLIRLV